MRMRRTIMLASSWLVGCCMAVAQQTAGGGDVAVNTASLLVGKALFLRGFYLNNELTYDADGRVEGSLKVERRAKGEIELDGVRVAIRYNTDSHEFQRHALNDEKMRLVVKDHPEWWHLLELQDSDTAVVFGDVFYGAAAGDTDLFGAEFPPCAGAWVDRLSPVCTCAGL
jgi:hypothetical protein